MALRSRVTVLNTPGTIDSDYRGEVGVILANHGARNFAVYPGDRIAQLVFNKVETVEFVKIKEFTQPDTVRGDEGFGSTGEKSLASAPVTSPPTKKKQQK